MSRHKQRPMRHADVRERPEGYAIVSHECDVLDQVAQLVQHRDSLEVSIRDAIQHARAEHGVSWAVIGGIVGLTKQGAQQRYG